MGVAGSGKSTLGAAVAERMGWPMIEGDDFHSDENKARMHAGVPLSDADREGWLRSLARELQQRPHGAVLTCSALKRTYRDLLRAASPGLAFVFLDISEEEALRRLRARGQHFFRRNSCKASLKLWRSAQRARRSAIRCVTSSSKPGGPNGRVAHRELREGGMTSAGIPKLRWRIGSLLGAGVLINYFDRISLSVAGPQLQQTLGLSPTELGCCSAHFSGPTHYRRFQRE